MFKVRGFFTVMVIFGACAHAEIMLPQMPRKSSEKPREVPPPAKMKWERHKLSDHLNEGMAVFDVNNDGKLDITAGPNWFEGPEFKPHPLRELNEILAGEFVGNNSEHGIDINGDGWTDVLAGSWFSDKVYWYENPGKEGLAQGKLWAQHFVADGQPSHEGNVLQDLDGDGAPELIVNNWAPELPLSVIRIKCGKEPKSEVVKLANPGGGHGIVIGDVNGDKRTDIMTPAGWFEQPAENPWGHQWKLHKMNVDLFHTSVPGIMTDLNGDGKNDVIIGHAHNFGLFWLEQGPVKDGEVTWIKHDIDDSYSQVHCLVWTDLDGDNRMEVVTGKRWRGHCDADPGSHQPMCLFRYTWDNKAQKFERDTIAFDDGVATGMQIRVADLDKDGKSDIAVAGKTGTYVLLNRGK